MIGIPVDSYGSSVRILEDFICIRLLDLFDASCAICILVFARDLILSICRAILRVILGGKSTKEMVLDSLGDAALCSASPDSSFLVHLLELLLDR